MHNLRFFRDIFSDFHLELSFGGTVIDAAQFQLREQLHTQHESVYTGSLYHCNLRVQVERLDAHTLVLCVHLDSEQPFCCDSIRMSAAYEAPDADLGQCYVPGGALDCGRAGLHRLSDRPLPPEDIRFCGLFSGSREPCLLLATQLPCSQMLLYQAALLRSDCVRFTAVNRFTPAERYHLQTERMLVITGLTPLAALQRYAGTLPEIPPSRLAPPLRGWSTWDYYFTCYRMDDLRENMAQIKTDEQLSPRLKYIFLDDGWQYREGEWHENYRFPQGLSAVAAEIQHAGFTPAIWTNGCQVYPLSEAGLRRGEMLLTDDDGNAILSEGRCIIDPTHPDGEAYLYQLYRSLYDAGFRVFKVDFVSTLQLAVRFHDGSCGVYDAIRRLFAIIRRAVGKKSILIGCSYPPECGAGIVDYNRFAVDIHNHWSHVLWILEYLQMGFWQNGRLYRIDPDFLLVRGSDTSRERETNVYNPAPNAPAALDSPANRWRLGNVFTRDEAETWANIVVFAAGNIILGDRLSMLNDAGLSLVRSHLTPNRQTAVPLDLGDGVHAGLWYSAADRKLLVINVHDTPQTIQLCFADYHLAAPSHIRCEQAFSYQDGTLTVPLRAHESAVFSW